LNDFTRRHQILNTEIKSYVCVKCGARSLTSDDIADTDCESCQIRIKREKSDENSGKMKEISMEEAIIGDDLVELEQPNFKDQKENR